MPTISLAKKPEGLAIGRPSVKLKLVSGHMPVKRSINFATVGEKPIDWRVAAPAIALIIVIAGMISKVAVYDRFAALNAARAEVRAMQTEISQKEEYYANLADISEDYAHYTTSEMTEEERDRVSRVTVADVVQRLILPVAPLDAWTIEENTLSIHISSNTLTEITAMVNAIQADPAVSTCAITSESTTASSTEKVSTEETISAEVQIIFKGMLQTIEENKAAEEAAKAAAQTPIEAIDQTQTAVEDAAKALGQTSVGEAARDLDRTLMEKAARTMGVAPAEEGADAP